MVKSNERYQTNAIINEKAFVDKYQINKTPVREAIEKKFSL